jgi:hypothetical protein
MAFRRCAGQRTAPPALWRRARCAPRCFGADISANDSVQQPMVYRNCIVFYRLLPGTGTVEILRGQARGRGGLRNRIQPRSLPKAPSFSVEPLRRLL